MNENSTKRAVVFAHWDKDAIIDDYVVYYLSELKKISSFIVFVSDSDVSVEECQKIATVTDVHIVGQHGEYDFGSYKRGFIYMMENHLLEQYDEIVFANDSCYGPIYPFSEVFDAMQNQSCDFWGLVENKSGYLRESKRILKCYAPHLQSYFLVFRKNVFTSDIFVDFINSIHKEQDKMDVIIHYEIGISRQLVRNGFNYRAYVVPDSEWENLNPLHDWELLLGKYRLPLVKCGNLRNPTYNYLIDNYWQKRIELFSNYPCELIQNNLQRTRKTSVLLFLYKILSNIPLGNCCLDILSRIVKFLRMSNPY